MNVIGASIQISVRAKQMNVAQQLPENMKNNDMRGLLGNYNGIPSDDLISHDGQTVDSTASEKVIYHNFGETCESLDISYTRKIMNLDHSSSRFENTLSHTLTPFFYVDRKLLRSFTGQFHSLQIRVVSIQFFLATRNKTVSKSLQKPIVAL